MKPLHLLTFVCLAAGFSATAQDTLYFNKAWRDTTASAASYYRIRTRQGSNWQVNDHYLNGKMQMTGAFSDDSCHVRQGPFTWYDSTGHPTRETIFADNKVNGKETIYMEGKVELKGTYKNGKKDGDFIGYYPDGKISGKAKYVNDKQVSGTSYKPDGSVNADITDFLKESKYPGGPEEWLAFLNKHFNYPKAAIRHKIEGEVIVQFIVDEQGKISDLTVIKSVSPELDEEAVRVIAKSSGKWSPAIYGGRLIKSYKKQPIIFRLQQT